MSELRELTAVLIGIAARLVIPILLTAVIVVVLRMLDAHWQSEASLVPPEVEKPACWEMNNCPPDARQACPGYLSELPCWQARRLPNNYLRAECLGCKVFLQAPAPVVG